MTDLTKLAPCEVWTEFEAITRVPRPSKKEEKIRDYLVGWAKEHGLEYRCDETGNVVIRKPATTGYEGRPTVILQSHMDMVCEKNSDVAFDFEHDAIRTRIDDGWVRAEGTTLGADDGIGMAAALAMLASATVAHPALEALFTVDEETGLTGAFGLGEGMLTGKYLINLDSEDEGELFIGCAGGVDTVAKFSPMVTPAPDGFEYFRIDVKGLAGGHSGDDIEKGRANSNKLMARLLYELLPYGPVRRRQPAQRHSARGVRRLRRSRRDGRRRVRALPCVRRRDRRGVQVHRTQFADDPEQNRVGRMGTRSRDDAVARRGARRSA